MPSVGIIGTGLVGSSVGLRARREGYHVSGFDSGAAAIEALELGALDEIGGREHIYRSCDLVVIATPIAAACRELELLRAREPAWKLLIDVASVKRPIVKAGEGVRNFVATHPLAGNEGSGPKRASALLFDGRTWAYVPSGEGALDLRFAEFARALGAQPYAIAAQRHDEVVALTSHLPQLVALLLARRIREAGPEAESLCGPAGREILRLGAPRPELWNEIFAANADTIAPEVTKLRESLEAAYAALGR
jgi:prephenate dehydrogenase